MDKNKKMDIVSQLEECSLLSCERGEERILEMLEKYIDTHKWLLNESTPYEISYISAAFSWFENVYRPLMFELERFPIALAFKGWDLFDVFSGVSDRHYYLSEDGKYHSYAEALRDFVLEKSNNVIARILTKFYY
jgi:hypothetical protein